MLTNIRHLRRRFFGTVQNHIKRWLKPKALSLVNGANADLTRGKADLIKALASVPMPTAEERPQTGKNVAFPVLRGLHHDTRRAA